MMNDSKELEYIIQEVKDTAEKDRILAKKQGNYNAAVYFQGKIVACNEILELLKD